MSADCGCTIIPHRHVSEPLTYFEIVYCPLHAAAPALLAELQNALSRASWTGMSRAREAIAKATEPVTL